MKEVWKELKQREDDSESAPLASSALKAPVPSCASSPGAAKAEDTDILDSGFTLRSLGAKAIRWWLVFQAVGLFYQLLLWREVSGYLAIYEEAVEIQCSANRRQHGVCIGPMWNLSTWQDFVLSDTSSWENSKSFDFFTHSSPPTFLIVVDPVSETKDDKSEPNAAPDVDMQTEEAKDVHWSLDVSRVDPYLIGNGFHRFHKGQQAMTFEDLSLEAQQAQAAKGRVGWRAKLNSRYRHKARFVAFVEDSATEHVAQVHGSCAFGRSWKSFNEQHQGRSHKTLAWCRFLLGVFLLVGGAAVYVVHSESSPAVAGQMGKYRFHTIVGAKFVFQDIPQQICMVLYLFGWYESNGLRCQLCLFHPDYCTQENPFHFANLVAILCTLLSSVSNQLLIRPVYKKAYTEDDICLQYTIRVSGVCVATLPFTSGMCWASQSLVSMPLVMHLLFAIPCGIGWLTMVGLICVPILVCCDEDC